MPLDRHDNGSAASRAAQNRRRIDEEKARAKQAGVPPPTRGRPMTRGEQLVRDTYMEDPEAEKATEPFRADTRFGAKFSHGVETDMAALTSPSTYGRAAHELLHHPARTAKDAVTGTFDEYKNLITHPRRSFQDHPVMSALALVPPLKAAHLIGSEVRLTSEAGHEAFMADHAAHRAVMENRHYGLLQALGMRPGDLDRRGAADSIRNPSLPSLERYDQQFPRPLPAQPADGGGEAMAHLRALATPNKSDVGQAGGTQLPGSMYARLQEPNVLRDRFHTGGQPEIPWWMRDHLLEQLRPDQVDPRTGMQMLLLKQFLGPKE